MKSFDCQDADGEDDNCENEEFYEGEENGIAREDEADVRSGRKQKDDMEDEINTNFCQTEIIVHQNHRRSSQRYKDRVKQIRVQS